MNSCDPPSCALGLCTQLSAGSPPQLEVLSLSLSRATLSLRPRLYSSLPKHTFQVWTHDMLPDWLVLYRDQRRRNENQ